MRAPLSGGMLCENLAERLGTARPGDPDEELVLEPAQLQEPVVEPTRPQASPVNGCRGTRDPDEKLVLEPAQLQVPVVEPTQPLGSPISQQKTPKKGGRGSADGPACQFFVLSPDASRRQSLEDSSHCLADENFFPGGACRASFGGAAAQSVPTLQKGKQSPRKPLALSYVQQPCMRPSTPQKDRKFTSPPKSRNVTSARAPCDMDEENYDNVSVHSLRSGVSQSSVCSSRISQLSKKTSTKQVLSTAEREQMDIESKRLELASQMRRNDRTKKKALSNLLRVESAGRVSCARNLTEPREFSLSRTEKSTGSSREVSLEPSEKLKRRNSFGPAYSRGTSSEKRLVTPRGPELSTSSRASRRPSVGGGSVGCSVEVDAFTEPFSAAVAPVLVRKATPERTRQSTPDRTRPSTPERRQLTRQPTPDRKPRAAATAEEKDAAAAGAKAHQRMEAKEESLRQSKAALSRTERPVARAASPTVAPSCVRPASAVQQRPAATTQQRESSALKQRPDSARGAFGSTTRRFR